MHKHQGSECENMICAFEIYFLALRHSLGPFGRWDFSKVGPPRWLPCRDSAHNRLASLTILIPTQSNQKPKGQSLRMD